MPTKAQQDQQRKAEAIELLRESVNLQPGDTIYTLLKDVAKSGMTRWVDVYVMRDNEPRRITYSVAEAIGYTYDMRHEAIKVGGCGFDAGFDVVYALGRVLFPAFECIGERCPSNDHSNGDRDYTPHLHSSGGYAFNHRWLGR